MNKIDTFHTPHHLTYYTVNFTIVLPFEVFWNFNRLRSSFVIFLNDHTKANELSRFGSTQALHTLPMVQFSMAKTCNLWCGSMKFHRPLDFPIKHGEESLEEFLQTESLK